MMNDNERPSVPLDELRRALGDDPNGLAAADDLHHAWQSETPDRTAIEGHVDRLRGIHTAEAVILNWWESPRVQAVVKSLTDAQL
jgi:hypothetical protein